jgi:sulfate adenylyltransferase subunit 1
MEAIKGDAILQLNDVGTVALSPGAPIFSDTYKTNPRNGTFILIDTSTNNTVAVGFIEQLS